MKLSKKDETVTAAPTADTRVAIATTVFEQLGAAKTADDVRDVVRANYGTLGHKIINRMLLGDTPEKALRIQAN